MIIDGFANLCAFILLRLKLWIAAVFALLFIIVCVFGSIPLTGITVKVFIAGVFITAFIGLLWMSLDIYKKSYSQGAPTQYEATKIDRRDYDGYEPYSQSRAREQGGTDGYSQRDYDRHQEEPMPAPKNTSPKNLPPQYKYPETLEDTQKHKYNYTAYDAPKKTSRLSELTSTKPLYDDFADLKKKYLSEQYGVDESTYDRREYNNPLRSESPQERKEQNKEYYVERAKSQLSSMSSEEKPMIFAMRRDPDVLVYEYSDRLMFYRKSKRGQPVLERVEYKS